MISHLRAMFGILIIALVVSVFIIAITSNQNSTKYRISIPHGQDYYTNSYISNGNCITFKNECGCKDEKTVTVCGNYTIITK